MFNKLIFILFFLIQSQVSLAEVSKNQLTQIRIGWQIPWAIQGQIVQILKKTSILKNNGIEAQFIGKTSGPELNELALGEQVDLIFTADQPASTLFMKSPEWLGISRLMYNRTATYVPLKSKIKNLTDLNKKQVGVPFGTAAQRIIFEAVNSSHVSDVHFVNLGMTEHLPLINRSKETDEKWGDFDALSGFDPIPANLEVAKQVKTIHQGKVCALVVINKKFLQQNKNVSQKIIKSIKEAYQFYQSHVSEANAWFREESKLFQTNEDALILASQFEPNLKSGAQIKTAFSEEDFEMIQKAADFVSQSTNKKIKIKDFVTNEYQD